MVHLKTIQLTFTGPPELLNDLLACEKLLDAIVEQIGLTKLHSVSHQFEPQGVSVVQLLAESHIALHTWPESSQGYITLTSCNTEAVDEPIIEAVLRQAGLQIVSSDAVAGSRS